MISRPLLILLCGCTLAGPVAAGSLDAPAAPTAPGSAMYTLEDLYQRLNAGTAGTPRPGAFVEPAAGPSGTMHTLNDIMAKMPAPDNTNGATAANVLSGRTFWGLTGGAWGLQTGTMATPTVNNTTTSQIAGYYNAFNLATVDTDLTAANIKSDVIIFGVAGTYGGSGGTISAPFPVAKTGQTTPYATGDDGDLQKGVASPNPRFSSSAIGTVTDNLTGLVWLRNANCTDTVGGVAKPNGYLPWASAMTWAAGLANGSCSLIDGSVAGQWRLPTIKELNSLVNAGAFNPALPAGYINYFTGVQSTSDYWSSTTSAPNPSNALFVYLEYGFVSARGKTGNGYVWPVRGGQ